jgi:hypothetical protein
MSIERLFWLTVAVVAGTFALSIGLQLIYDISEAIEQWKWRRKWAKRNDQ